ncbi:MAG: hypothetical protein ABI333_02465 [bacterium]
MKRTLASVILLGLSLLPVAPASAQFTETLPKNTFMLDVAYGYSRLRNAYDNNGKKIELIDRVDRYDPGGGLQGTIVPKGLATYDILILQLRYGITDYLSLAVGIPIVLRTSVNPDLQWIEGDYQWPLGRRYSADDFWQWAESMGQPKPGKWEGNKGVLSDIVFGARYRFSDHISKLKKLGLGLSLTAYYAAPTGKKKDPELLVAGGTTSWELHFQGDLGFHLSIDKTFLSIDKRITIGLDLFYQVMLPHTFDTPRGTVNPLLLRYEPYAGPTYKIDPGDFMGASLGAHFVIYKGPAKKNWISKSAERAKNLPGILAFRFTYSFTYIGQTDYTSESTLWDWSNEKIWRPGYKNTLTFTLIASLLRVGAPLQVYFRYRSLSLIPGKNCRSADVLTVGIRIPAKFW